MLDTSSTPARPVCSLTIQGISGEGAQECVLSCGTQPLSRPGELLAEQQHEQEQQRPNLLVADGQLDCQLDHGISPDFAGRPANWLGLAFVKRRAWRLQFAYLGWLPALLRARVALRKQSLNALASP